MAQKKNKKSYRIKVTSKTYRKVNATEVAKALGAKHITDSKEKEEFRKRYGPRPRGK